MSSTKVVMRELIGIQIALVLVIVLCRKLSPNILIVTNFICGKLILCVVNLLGHVKPVEKWSLIVPPIYSRTANYVRKRALTIQILDN